MNFDNLNRWLTLCANLGVLAGIVFLAVETNQNNALMESEARYKRADFRIAANYQFLENPELASAYRKSFSNQELNEEESFLVNRYVITTFYSLQVAYDDYVRGLIPESDASPSTMITFLRNNQHYANAWQQATGPNSLLRTDFVKWIEDKVGLESAP